MISVILCFAMVFATMAFVEGKVNVDIKEKCDFTAINSGIDSLLAELNSNAQYTDFIANSKYSAVELVVGKTNAYYFIYDKSDGKVKQVENAQADFTMKATCKQMNRVPQKVKSDILTQCFKTDWCMNRILGK